MRSETPEFEPTSPISFHTTLGVPPKILHRLMYCCLWHVKDVEYGLQLACLIVGVHSTRVVSEGLTRTRFFENNISMMRLIVILTFLQKLHPHHVLLLAQISLTLSRHLSLSSIAPNRSSWLHPISTQSSRR